MIGCLEKLVWIFQLSNALKGDKAPMAWFDFGLKVIKQSEVKKGRRGSNF